MKVNVKKMKKLQRRRRKKRRLEEGMIERERQMKGARRL